MNAHCAARCVDVRFVHIASRGSKSLRMFYDQIADPSRASPRSSRWEHECGAHYGASANIDRGRR